MKVQILGSKQNSQASVTEYLSETSNGIYLKGDHAKMIWQGNKTIIIQNMVFEHVKGKDLYLIGNNLCYGIIRVKDIKPVNIEEFRKMSSEHKITEKERNEWWTGKKQLYAYSFEFRRFDDPKRVAVEEGVQTFVKDVNFLSELSEYESLMAQAFGSPGGKSRVSAKLNAMMPKHKIYVEAFAGGAALFWKKEPSEVEVLNDLDSEIAGAYRFIKSATKEEVAGLKKRKWISDKELFFRLLKSKPESDLDIFYKFFYTHFHSYGAGRKSFGYKDGECKIYDRVLHLQERLKNTKIRNEDYKSVIKEFDSPDTFFFFDPPYPEDWPYPDKINNWGESNVKEMAELLHNIKGKFLITINNLPWIKESFSGFKQDSFFVPRSLRKGDNPKKELLVSNYDIRSINLSEIPSFVSKFSDAVLIKDFVSVVGSSVESDKYNDVDILVRLSDPTDFIKRAIETRIGKEYSEQKKLHFIWGDSEGPHDSFVPVYDLKLSKLEPKMVTMSDGITPMSPFNPMKPGKKFYGIEETLNYLFGGANVS